jgi:nucleotide-binding universal stress UspA family protein
MDPRRQKPWRVVVPHDYGPGADSALAWARTLLRSTDGTLVLLHVILVPAPPIKRVPMIPALRPTEDPTESRARLRAIAERHRQEAEVDVFETSDAGPGIVKRARDLGADLLVVGVPPKARGGVSHVGL